MSVDMCSRIGTLLDSMRLLVGGWRVEVRYLGPWAWTSAQLVDHTQPFVLNTHPHTRHMLTWRC